MEGVAEAAVAVKVAVQVFWESAHHVSADRRLWGKMERHKILRTLHNWRTTSRVPADLQSY